MIIFDEKKYAETILAQKNKGVFVKQRDLNILTKYYYYQGLKKPDVRLKLVEYASVVDSNFNEIVSDSSLDFALRHYGRSKLRTGSVVTVYDCEIAKMHELESIKEQRIIFVMLVVSKVFNDGKHEDYYYNGLLSDVFKLAKLTGCSKEERIQIVHGLTKHGAIEPNLRGGYRITIATNEIQEGDNNVVIDDFENIMDKFPALCSVCKKRMVGLPKRRTYCDSCYEEKRKNDIRENVVRLRNRRKS